MQTCTAVWNNKSETVSCDWVFVVCPAWKSRISSILLKRLMCLLQVKQAQEVEALLAGKATLAMVVDFAPHGLRFSPTDQHVLQVCLTQP
jgi:hypothetical protein